MSKFRMNIPENNKVPETAAEYQDYVTGWNVPPKIKYKNQKMEKPKRKNEEHEIQKAYFDVLKRYDLKYPELNYIYAIPNGGHRHIATAVKLKAEGVKSGVPDIFIPIPKRNIAGKYLETKTSIGKESPNQKMFRDFLINQGYDYALCRSTLELLQETEKYLNINLT